MKNITFYIFIFCLLQTGIIHSLYQHKYNPKVITKVIKENNPLHEELLKKIFKGIPTVEFTTTVTVTAYSARSKETDKDPWFTADMSLSRVGMLAISRDLFKKYGLYYGQIVILGDYGIFQIHDTMNKRFTNRVDILMANAEAAKRFGKQTATLTWTNI